MISFNLSLMDFQQYDTLTVDRQIENLKASYRMLPLCMYAHRSLITPYKHIEMNLVTLYGKVLSITREAYQQLYGTNWLTTVCR